MIDLSTLLNGTVGRFKDGQYDCRITITGLVMDKNNINDVIVQAQDEYGNDGEANLQQVDLGALDTGKVVRYQDDKYNCPLLVTGITFDDKNNDNDNNVRVKVRTETGDDGEATLQQLSLFHEFNVGDKAIYKPASSLPGERGIGVTIHQVYTSIDGFTQYYISSRKNKKTEREWVCESMVRPYLKTVFRQKRSEPTPSLPRKGARGLSPNMKPRDRNYAKRRKHSPSTLAYYHSATTTGRRHLVNVEHYQPENNAIYACSSFEYVTSENPSFFTNHPHSYGWLDSTKVTNLPLLTVNEHGNPIPNNDDDRNNTVTGNTWHRGESRKKNKELFRTTGKKSVAFDDADDGLYEIHEFDFDPAHEQEKFDHYHIHICGNKAQAVKEMWEERGRGEWVVNGVFAK